MMINKLSGRLIVFRDITDRKKAEKDLCRAMNRLQAQLIEIGTLQSQLREQAIRDALTGLFNRRYLEETLERELARAEREGCPLCVIMMDLDHFKDINDTYGHEAGDVVLKTLAETVTHQSRHGDFVCRYGGEEFVLLSWTHASGSSGPTALLFLSRISLPWSFCAPVRRFGTLNWESPPRMEKSAGDW